jgi:hypothetical protein
MLRRLQPQPSRETGSTLPLLNEDKNWEKQQKLSLQDKHWARQVGRLAFSIASFLWQSTDTFLHARTGPRGCRLAGYIRVSYALLYLYSRTLLVLEAPFLFDPHSGVMPYRATKHQLNDSAWSIFQSYPDSSTVLYLMLFVGWFNGLLLLLGIAPRLQALGIYFFLNNLYNHNRTLWDHQEVMLRIWAFMLLWLPLDHVTVYDGFGGLVFQPTNKVAQTTSWPMWTVRLWQVYTCLVYIGAGLGKLNSKVWRNGTALYYCYYEGGFGRFFPEFVIEYLFNRMWAIKLATWTSLWIECLCFITIWPLTTRKWTFILIVMLHIGIELALLMHIFEYLSVLGWLVFFILPNDGNKTMETTDNSIEKMNQVPTTILDTTRTTNGKKDSTWTQRRKVFETLIAITLLFWFTADTLPKDDINDLAPRPLRQMVKNLMKPIKRGKMVTRFMKRTGLHSGAWTLFSGKPPHSNQRLTAVVRFRDSTKSPILWKAPEWSAYTLYERERYYWSDCYYYYLLQDSGVEMIPFFASLAKHISKEYSRGSVDFDLGNLIVYPENDIQSISFVGHWEQGMDPPKKLSPWKSVPRKYQRFSECQYVLLLDKTSSIRRYDLQEMMYDFDGHKDFSEQSGCSQYDKRDNELHQQGSFA